MLVEAAWIAIRSPGPLRAFGERVRARRGAQVAAVAVARKLVVLCWQLLSKDEDYAFARPSLTRQKTRRLELAAGASRRATPPRRADRFPDQQLSALRSASCNPRPSRHTGAWSPTGAPAAPKGGAGATPGRASQQALEGQSRAAGHKPLTPALRYVSHPHHPQNHLLHCTKRPGATPPADTRPPAPRRAPRRDKSAGQTRCTVMLSHSNRCGW